MSMATTATPPYGADPHPTAPEPAPVPSPFSADAPPWMSAVDLMPTGPAAGHRWLPEARTDVAEGLRAAGEAGLLDEGVDGLLAESPSYAQDALARIVDLVADLAGDARTLARGIAEQRVAIEVLARGLRTPSNERLLRALRRGRLVGALATIDPWAPVLAAATADGSWTLTGRVEVSADLPGGSAVLIPVRVGAGRRALAWIGAHDAGVTSLPEQARPFGARSRALLLEGVRVRADEIVAGDLGALLTSLAPAQARLDAALALADFVAAGEAYLAMREFAASEDGALAPAPALSAVA